MQDKAFAKDAILRTELWRKGDPFTGTQMASKTRLNRSTVMCELGRMVDSGEADKLPPDTPNGAAYYQKRNNGQMLLRFKWDRKLSL